VADVILVIDDNPLLLATMGAALSGPDTVAVLANCASDALRDLDRGISADAVVIDLDMRNGPAVLSRLAPATLDGEIPVVVLSSRPRRLIEAAMADAVLVKPFEVSDLRACVRHACERRRGAS
jgi:DNA-binding response OmpR family regulator